MALAQKYMPYQLEVLFDYDEPREGQLYLEKGRQLRLIELIQEGWLMAMDLSTCLFKHNKTATTA